MLLSTTEELQGFAITDYLGLVHGEVVSGANILRDVMATVTDFVGGRSAAYEEELVHSREAVLQELSDRELQVFDLLGRGLGTRQIAETLNVSIKTVQAYCARIKQKMHLNTASQLLREAVRWHDRQMEGSGAA